MYEVYPQLVKHLLDSEFSEVNERTGRGIKLLPYPVALLVDLRSRRLPLPGNRRVYPKTAAAEVAWFLSGTKDVSWLRKHCPIWDKFTEDDGVTIEASYGYRWRHHFGRDQIHDALLALVKDPTNRRVYVSMWDPATDGLTAEGQRNVPCPVGFTLSIVDGVLNSCLMIRSSDVFVGLPYDVMGHALLMDAFATNLDVRLGWMHVTLAHPHLYSTHMLMARESLEETWAEKPEMPGWDLMEIETAPDDYVAEVKRLGELVRPHPFSCRPEVVA